MVGQGEQVRQRFAAVAGVLSLENLNSARWTAAGRFETSDPSGTWPEVDKSRAKFVVESFHDTLRDIFVSSSCKFWS